jgi:ATP-binding cassette, subfamily F, member 3
MNSYADGDVYPVDVSTTPSDPTPSDEDRCPLSSCIASPFLSPCHGILLTLANPEVYLSDILYSSQYDPKSLEYMLQFFRTVAQSIPSDPASPPSPAGSPEAVPIEPMQGSARDMLQDRAGIIVLREDLDFYVIPPRRDIDPTDMMEVKRAAGKALLEQDGIFSGLRKSEEPGTTEQHLIEMLTAGYVPYFYGCLDRANRFQWLQP